MNYINDSELANKRFIKLENSDLREAQGKYVPKNGEIYFFVDIDGSIMHDTYSRFSNVDRWILRHTLVFRTREECEEYRDFLDLLDEYTFEPSWDDPVQERWMMCFNHVEHRIEWLRLYAVQYHSFCFDSKEKGEAFVNAVGTDVVEKYMFDYWE